MRILSTKTHGVLDYLVGLLLLIAPWMLGFAQGGAETWVPVVLGAGAIVYSLLTNYEWGAARIIPMRVHLILDIMSGIFLAASPWLFGFSDYVYLPHLLLGIGEILAALITDPQPRISGNKSSSTSSDSTTGKSSYTTGNR